MKIVDERKENEKVCFGDLGYGDVFKWDDCIYVKVLSNYDTVNATNLCECRATSFMYNTKVTPLNAELVIRGEKNERSQIKTLPVLRRRSRNICKCWSCRMEESR